MPTVHRNLDDILGPVIEDFIKELKLGDSPYDEVLNDWVDQIRKTLYEATVEYNPFYWSNSG